MSEGNKSKDKFMSAEEAVRCFIKDGDMVALDGFTVSRNPMTLAWERSSAKIGRTCAWWCTRTARPWICW